MPVHWSHFRVVTLKESVLRYQRVDDQPMRKHSDWLCCVSGSGLCRSPSDLFRLTEETDYTTWICNDPLMTPPRVLIRLEVADLMEKNTWRSWNSDTTVIIMRCEQTKVSLVWLNLHRQPWLKLTSYWFVSHNPLLPSHSGESVQTKPRCVQGLLGRNTQSRRHDKEKQTWL